MLAVALPAEDRDTQGASTDKEIVIGIRQRNGELRMFHAKDVKAGTIANSSERTSAKT